MNTKEGFIETEGGRTWYKIVGESHGVPVIVVHGGPGVPHDYLEPLSGLAEKRQVIFYDQLGCGNSGKSLDKKLWTVDFFVSELKALIRELELDTYCLLGHSWGAALAVSFSLSQPEGLHRLILSDPFISTKRWKLDAQRLILNMSDKHQKALLAEERDSEEFMEAKKEYYYRHVSSLRPTPVPVLKGSNKMNMQIYNHMWGPSEFEPTGALASFDPSKELSKIKVPVLLISGRNDEATPEANEYFSELFPNATTEVLESSEHLPQWTEPEEYLQKITSFLDAD